MTLSGNAALSGRRRRRRLSLARSAAFSGRRRRDSARETNMLARDAAAHRAMLIVGRFFTGRRARQRTACLGISGLAHLSSDNIASRDRLIASAAYCRVSYSTTTALVVDHVDAAADAHLLQCLCAKPLSEPSILNLRYTRTARLPRLPTTRMKAITPRQNPSRAMNECVRRPLKPHLALQAVCHKHHTHCAYTATSQLRASFLTERGIQTSKRLHSPQQSNKIPTCAR